MSTSRFFAAESIHKKIQFLFEIGFFGFSNPEDNRNPNQFSFCFSDGEDEFESYDESERIRLRYAIHPVFNEYLRLRVDENELIGFYDSKYLLENDTIH